MVFKPLKPASGDNLSDSQGDIQQNFQTSNDVFNAEHWPFDDTTTKKGKHRVVRFPVMPSPAIVTTANEIAIYKKSNELYFQPVSNGTDMQLTGSGIPGAYFSATTSGYSFLPAGFVLMWGQGTSGVGGGLAVTFLGTCGASFPTSCYQVTVSAETNNKIYGVTSITSTGFNFVSNGGAGIVFHFMAIGR